MTVEAVENMWHSIVLMDWVMEYVYIAFMLVTMMSMANGRAMGEKDGSTKVHTHISIAWIAERRRVSWIGQSEKWYMCVT